MMAVLRLKGCNVLCMLSLSMRLRLEVLLLLLLLQVGSCKPWAKARYSARHIHGQWTAHEHTTSKS